MKQNIRSPIIKTYLLISGISRGPCPKPPIKASGLQKSSRFAPLASGRVLLFRLGQTVLALVSPGFGGLLQGFV